MDSKEYENTPLVIALIVIMLTAIGVGSYLGWQETRAKKWCLENKSNVSDYFANCRNGGSVEQCAKLEHIYDTYKKRCTNVGN